MKDNLIKIPLQFFGESGEDDYDDFDDEYEDEDEEDEESEEDADGEDTDGDDDGSEGDGDEGAATDEDEDKGGDETADLIAELKALGYEGDDVKSLTASIKAQREKEAKTDASAERRAKQAAGKAHVKSATPSKSATGDGMAGYTSRDVEEMRQAIGKGCTKERARNALEKRLRANA